MIVKNEEKYLERCLNSVQGKIDEIIIADTGSTDRTIEIAEKYNSVVKHFEWINDFSAARNYSISDAKMEYILVLDADEYLDDNADLQKDLEGAKDYYKVMIKNYQGVGKTVFHRNIRLFKSGIGFEYSGKLHEQLNAYDKNLNYIGAESDIIIHHLGYLPEIIIEKDKKNRNYDIMVTELQENPTGYSYYNMGIVCMNDEKYDKALDMFNKSYPLSLDKAYIMDLLVRKGECLNLLCRTEEGIKLLLDAVRVFPKYTDLHYTLGKLFLDYGYLRDAEIEFLECLKLGEKVVNITAEGKGSYMAHYQLAVIYERQGKIGDSFDEAYKAVTDKKSFTPALSLYIKLMQQSGIQLDKIKEQLSEIYQIHTLEELEALIYSLYEIRNPLICEFGSVLENGNLNDIRAVAFMLDKQYNNSLEEWKKVDIISQSNSLDVVVMCLISKDRRLLDKIKSGFNFNHREWKTISGILLKESNGKLYLAPDIEKLLLKTGEYLLNINELEQFEYISTFLLQCSLDIQDRLASILLDNGYTDTALELLNTIVGKYPSRFESNILLGEAYMKQNKLNEALKCFIQSISLKDDYSTYEKIYDIYEMIGDKEKLDNLTGIMKEKFPLSIWLKRA